MEFATAGIAIGIRWNEQAETYEVKLPDSEWAALTPATYGSYDLTSNGSVVGGARLHLMPDGYDYTGFMEASASGGALHQAAFGIPTSTSEMPISGSASYSGELIGLDSCCHVIYGPAVFNFDFGAGTFAGYISPSASGAWSGGDLGRYDFVNTIYSTGSTSFSGGLLHSTNSLGGTFSGNFNGPGAAELMGQWQLQFDLCAIDWCEPGQVGTATGVVVAKRP